MQEDDIPGSGVTLKVSCAKPGTNEKHNSRDGAARNATIGDRIKVELSLITLEIPIQRAIAHSSQQTPQTLYFNYFINSTRNS